MQLADSADVPSESSGNSRKEPREDEATASTASSTTINNDDISSCSPGEELVLDVSGKSLEFPLLENSKGSLEEEVYVYRNVFNLIPKSVWSFGRLKNLKFFANEINLFPEEIGDLVGLKCLQVKIPLPGFSGLALSKLKGLKELDVSRIPPRSSVLMLLSEIAGLQCLTKLSVCHFSIRYLPPEIGCLKNLEYLDFSFNKIKSLPAEITYLSALISLKVANNKLVELPSGLSLLQRLENLDLSNNRLISFDSLELGLMHNLQTLNLQYNRLQNCSDIPPWMHCNLDGNVSARFNDDLISSSVEMDVFETAIQDDNGSISYHGSCHNPSSIAVSSSNNRCIASQKLSKRWKRRHYLQQRARQERLNNSRKWKGDGHAEVLIMEAGDNAPDNLDALTSGAPAEDASDIIVLNDDDKPLLSVEAKSENSSVRLEKDKLTSQKGIHVENGSSIELKVTSKRDKDEFSHLDVSLPTPPDKTFEHSEGSSSAPCRSSTKSKRHSDKDLDNPKRCKSWKGIDASLSLSCKYSNMSFCGFEDHLPDGFYDGGRDRPFKPLQTYENILHLDSHEVILVDRLLDAIVLYAQARVFYLKQMKGFTKDMEQAAVDNLQIASWLALFVSDHFGGSDRNAIVEKMRKTASGMNYSKPFVCTCLTRNSDTNNSRTSTQILGTVEDINFSDICESSLRSIKSKRNSIVVPIGAMQFGVCRHRALLLKYLCDQMKPPIACELVRGYLDFMPHAWNVILVKRNDSWVRMVVDACHPHDIREESDPEYFCRYIPLSRMKVCPEGESSSVLSHTFPSLSKSDEIERAPSSSVILCKFGSVDAVAKVRTLEVWGTSVAEVKDFEYSCLGEIRILGALKHPCIVEMYGHQISFKWITAEDRNLEGHVMQSAILMEFIKGGSLRSHIERLAKAGGKKHAPVDLSLCIARDIACALAELHARHIIHRDIKSENVLIDLNEKRSDGRPIVKLCDFDRAVPLMSSLHTCCIAHLGIPPPNICVGTPRWMAPEVLHAMHNHNFYGLEVDIWSYGCLLYELLTLQVPYCGLSEVQIHELLQSGKRPQLTEELKALESPNATTMSQSSIELEGSELEVKTLRFLIDVYRHCTEKNPSDRPTAEELNNMLLERQVTSGV
ncbi:hypothetical protein SLEP1_g50984 [Rubroshorea leprosula]|uniref:Protein kinase domain-containing protein n=1 Tax=Rubroshorea leprosula TaxID=152421 RepID=A0AAV5M1U6_9ROSI|nr:hypothetical protein SLEP1_g50984 [Rubroshorea leprosula]